MTARPIGEIAGAVVNKLAADTGRVKQFPDTGVHDMSQAAVPDPYQMWRRMIAGEKVSLHDEPICGFFRTRPSKGSREFVGVAIFPRDGELIAVRGRGDVQREVQIDWVWPWCGRYPITEAAYRTWEEFGTWPDDHPMPEAAPREPGAADNEPEDPVEMLRDQIESARAGAADYATVESDEQASRAQSLRSRLLELSRQADQIRSREKEPHLEASRQVDATFMPLVKDAKAAADGIQHAMSAWETKKANEARAAIAAERRRLEDEVRARAEAERQAAAAGRPAPEPEFKLESEPATTLPQPTTQVRGAYGRAAAVKVVNVVKHISDRDVVLQRYINDERLWAFLLDLVRKDVAKGFIVPGVQIEEERQVA